MLVFDLKTSAQIIVDDTYTPQQLVEDVLIGGGVQVSNFQFSGNAQARGYFDGSNSNIGLDSGIIISTGRVADAPGPNGTPISDTGTEFNGTGDSELTAISGSPLGTYDAAFIEFDFVPSSDSVQFNYVFASNEYMLYVGTGVNDVFAFFISGPGIVGEQNVALIPGTTTPVTIDNVNANTNAQFYVDNENPPGSTVEYNGFTQVFTATAVLTPCESYHIRLAIADGGDESFDSAVFLEAGSFTSPSVSLNAESSFSTSSSAQELVEGCSSMTLTFERSAPFDDPLSIGLSVSGTASVGADISNIPTIITFPAGSSTATLSFNVLEDGLIEGVEDMTITLDQLNPCSTGPPTSVSFIIQDVQPITLTITPDVTFVCPEEYEITVVPSGGYPDYQYNWIGSTETDESITVFPITSTTYSVTVSDECGQSTTASTAVLIPDYEPLGVSVEDVIVCNGDEATLSSTVSGGLGNIAYSWEGGGSDPSYTFTPLSTITVTLEVTDDCDLSESATANVMVDEVQASFTYRLTGHASVQFTSTTVNVYDFVWDFGDGTGSTRESPEHDYDEEGTYLVTLTVVNANGCEMVLEDSVTVYPPLHVYIPNAFTPNGDGLNDVFGMIGEGYLYYDLEIFDRWGNVMRRGRFKNELAWDGTYKGKLVPSNQYIYRIFVQPPIGIEFREAGALQVLSGNDK
jgi:gliding motility-associated-like protein